MAIETTVRTHTLKTDPDVFDAVASGEKTFEIRWNDRGYQVGDVLFLRKTRYTGAQMIEGLPLEYIGDPIRATVTYVLQGPVYGLAHGWVIMGIAVAAPRPEAGQKPDPVVITLGKGDKLVADIYQDDEEGVIYKAGVGIFDPEPGKVYGIGVKDTRIDGMQISPDRNPLALIWSDKPESLQVIIDELQEAIGRLTGQQPTPRPEAVRQTNSVYMCPDHGSGVYVGLLSYPAGCCFVCGKRPEAGQQSPDKSALTRELDVLLNGEEGAAPQASLCDLVAQLRLIVSRTGNPVLAQPAPRPVPTSERLPTVADGDPWGRLLAFSVLSKVWHIVRFHEVNRQDYSHWMCYMRLPSPQRPAEPDGGAV